MATGDEKSQARQGSGSRVVAIISSLLMFDLSPIELELKQCKESGEDDKGCLEQMPRLYISKPRHSREPKETDASSRHISRS